MSRRRRTTIGLVAALIALQLGALAIYRLVESRRSGSAAFRAEAVARRPAPELEVVLADGKRLSLAELRGRPVLVHFWATWCPPCRDELPGLVAAARRFQGQDLVLLAVSVDQDWSAVRAFFGGEVPPEVVRGGPDAHRRYDVVALPDTYLVARDGQLALRYGGARDWRSEAAARHLAEALASH